jgi:hypothetical protein
MGEGRARASQSRGKIEGTRIIRLVQGEALVACAQQAHPCDGEAVQP